MAQSELKKARKSLGGGRVDEALLFLWNALEPARLEGGLALRELERLAVEAHERGDESQRREAEKLLATLRGVPGDVEANEADAVQQEADVKDADVQEGVQEVEVSDRPAEAEASAEPDTEPQTPARRGLARYAIPAIFLLFVVVNVLARVFGD